MNASSKNHHKGIKNVEKIKNVIKKEFQKELNFREKQLELIQQRINETQKTLHVLRYVIVTTYYNTANRNVPVVSQEETTTSIETNPQRLHPAVKKLLTNFTAGTKLNTSDKLKTRSKIKSLTHSTPVNFCIGEPSTSAIDNTVIDVLNTDSKLTTVNIKHKPSEIPLPTLIEYSATHLIDNNASEYSDNYKLPRNRSKKDYVVVVGNISKWMPAESEEDKSTHKWMVYVRGPKTSPSISHFVQKVVFYLHPSYKPNDVVEVKVQPFHLSRRGWGEFPLRVRIYFIHMLNKPVDIVHQLKLDKTFTGRQTLGNETVVNLQLFDGTVSKCETIVKEECCSDGNYLEHDYCHLDIKEEYLDDDSNIIDLDHSYCSRSTVPLVSTRIEQPENELIYGLNYDNPSCSEPIIEETILDDTDILRAPPKLIVKNVILPTNKRKLHEPVEKQSPEKKKRFCDIYSTSSSKFNLEITKPRYKNVLQVLPFLFKHLPIITKLALNSTYRCTYPYVAASLEEYASWNVGKRLSSEWFQAKTILHIIRTNEIPDAMNWTTKRMIMYARAHGYTPLANYTIFRAKSTGYLYDFIPNGEVVQHRKLIEPVDEVVDITSSIKGKLEKPEKYSKVTQLIDLNLQKVSSFLRQTVFDVGVILKPEEIVPGVLFNAAERVLLQAVLCLAEDLIRKARAKLVHEGNFQENTNIITNEYICEALSSRSEFNFLLHSDVG